MLFKIRLIYRQRHFGPPLKNILRVSTHFFAILTQSSTIRVIPKAHFFIGRQPFFTLLCPSS